MKLLLAICVLIFIFVLLLITFGEQIDKGLYRFMVHSTIRIPTNQFGCLTAGGSWGKLIMGSIETCSIALPDAGKICWSGFQCASGSCRIEAGGREFQPAIFGFGTCSRSFSNLGSYHPVHFGIRGKRVDLLD